MNWEVIYRKHSPGVYQYLLSLSSHAQEAEDLLQETFIKAMRSVATLREPEKIRSWLLTIARNLFLDFRKKQMRRNTGSIEDYSVDSVHFSAEDGSPEDHAIRGDFAHFLRRSLSDLPEAYQTAFTLGIMQKHSYKEIEEITGWSQAMVKTNVFRARKKMAAALSEFQG